MSIKLVSRILPSAQKYFCLHKPVNNIILPAINELSIFSALRSAEETQKDSNKTLKDAALDRSKVIPVETSIRYIQSEAYATTYGEQPVWKQYRRNHKGAIPPRKTRKTCIRKGQISSGNPCPICRDEYLVLHPQNVELLKQFISPFTGEVLSYSVTGICQRKYKDLLVAIEQAKDEGLLTYDVPFRTYDYSLYKPES